MLVVRCCIAGALLSPLVVASACDERSHGWHDADGPGGTGGAGEFHFPPPPCPDTETPQVARTNTCPFAQHDVQAVLLTRGGFHVASVAVTNASTSWSLEAEGQLEVLSGADFDSDGAPVGSPWQVDLGLGPRLNRMLQFYDGWEANLAPPVTLTAVGDRVVVATSVHLVVLTGPPGQRQVERVITDVPLSSRVVPTTGDQCVVFGIDPKEQPLVPSIVAARVDIATGSVTDSVELPGHPTIAQFTLLHRGAGQVALVWTEVQKLWYQEVDVEFLAPRGTPWNLADTERVAAGPPRIYYPPKLAQIGDRTLAVWTGSSGTEVRYAVLGPVGSPPIRGDILNATTRCSQDYEGVTVSPDGRFLVSWWDPYEGVTTRWVDADGTPGSQLQFPSCARRPGPPVLAPDSERVMAFWPEYGYLGPTSLGFHTWAFPPDAGADADPDVAADADADADGDADGDAPPDASTE